MDKNEFLKKIDNTKYDTYPLDKFLPILTVFKIFQDTYSSNIKKSEFLDNRKYKKMREGYWSLFACKALDKLENKEHLMIFPSDETSGDVNFCALQSEDSSVMNKLVFDVKEFEEHSDNFESFLNKVVIPKRDMGLYGIIIGLHKNVNGKSLAPLMVENENDRGVFIISALSNDDNNPYLAKVLFFHKGNILFNEEVSIEINFDKNDPMIIYHDILRDKII
jgi:hypothetical protein